MALFGVLLANAATVTDYIELVDFAVGDCVEAYYTAAPTGRTSLNLYGGQEGDILVHVDYRVDWYNKDTIYLNHYSGGVWGDDYELVEGIKSTPGSMLAWSICTGEKDCTISFNHLEVATYEYRSNATIIGFGYDNNGYDSALKEMCVDFNS